jgi:hypothetical protein
MRLSPNELRSRAHAFVASHKSDSDENKHTQTFWNDFFFDIFGVKRTRVAVYEKSVDKIKGAKGRIDLFWPGELLIEQKSLGRDLLGARIQALDYTHGLTDAEMPKRILSCDFKTWELLDLTTNQTTAFTLEDLPKYIDLFGFVLGRQTRHYADQDPVNIKASELVGILHDQLLASGYKGHKLEVFLTRIVFCLFADDTGIFEPRDILWDFLETRTATDGSDLGLKLAKLFEVLNTPETERQTALDPDLARFPYINGHLFAEIFPTPDFNADMRAALLNACRFDWTPISPAIFGSLFQSVMDAGERRKAGAHYTTEKNILKLIGPLFMDDLRAEFAAIKARRSGREAALRKFHDKLASLTFFDPACGAGNFLIIAYREIRRLELELLLELRDDRQKEADAAALSRVDVDQFYGIEISEFPARIAETALWMMDHLMNLELSAAFGQYYPRIPLKKAPTIVHGDALELDWTTILPPERCSYVLGNPPFIGHQNRDAKQVQGMHRVWGVTGQFNRLDFVTCWFKKAAEYAKGFDIPFAFVSTNSITQGEQAGILWPALFGMGLHITFGHRTFQWNSEARGKAAVHCVIVGLSSKQPAICRVFEYDNPKAEAMESIVPRLNGYLVNGPQWSVPARGKPQAGQKEIHKGSQPTDGARLKLPEGGHETFSNLILDAQDRAHLVQMHPSLDPWIRPYVGGDELISGQWRYCLWLKDASPKDYDFPNIRERLRRVRDGRLKSPTESVRDFANYPTLFTQDRQPSTGYIAIPEVSSETRDYIPIALLPADVIASNKLMIMPNGNLQDFALLTSRMHMAWMRTVAGRLESRYSYSPAVWFTFPMPAAANLSKLEPLAQAILDARASHPDLSLAQLYDGLTPPPNLREAHTKLDRAVDRLYRPAGFASDRERVEHLFALYESMQTPLLSVPKGKRKKKAI